MFFLQKQKYCSANNFVFSFENYDYFLDRNTSCKKFTTKYKTKNLFNRFLSKDFRIEFSNNLNTNGIEELRNRWQDEKKKNNEVITTTTSKYIKNLLKWDKDCFYFNIWFNNELVLQWVFFVFDNALINIYRTSLSRCKKQSNSSWEKNTFDKIDKFAIYWIFTNTKFDRIYYAGAHPNHKKLLEHKEIHSDGKIIYCKSMNNQG